jgi:hypothetical protein
MSASSERVRTLNRQISAITCGVDEQFFSKILDNAGMFAATEHFINKALEYDALLTDDDIHKAGRNLWTCLALQLIICRTAVHNQPAIHGYSMLYPYTDDYIDDASIDMQQRRAFQTRFRQWLAGASSQHLPPLNRHEQKCYDMVQEIAGHWPRHRYPQVFHSLLAIHDAQTQSMALFEQRLADDPHAVWQIVVAKGGTSVMADGWLVSPQLCDADAAWTFMFGVALQLLDDLQDVKRDVADGQCSAATLLHQRGFHEQLDAMARRLLFFVDWLINPEHPWAHVAGDHNVKYLRVCMLKMCFSLVLKTIAKDQTLFSSDFVRLSEQYCALPYESMKRVVLIKKLMTLVRNKQI